jgi:hypothetical protein
MKRIIFCMLALVVFAFCTTGAWAAQSQTVNVSATVPAVSQGLSVAISKVTGTTWAKDQTAINFGNLILDPVNHIFLPDSYFAVDIGVTDNSATVWTLTHTRSSLAGTSGNLDSKVNVTFVKQTTGTTNPELRKVSYANSNSVSHTKTQLAGGWLRIYYGIGTGDTTPGKEDATGVTPIGLDTPAGTYSGTVTITLTP